MDAGTIQFTELLPKLDSFGSLSYWLALVRDGDTWRLHTLLIEGGIAAGDEDGSSFAHEYEHAFFGGGRIDVATARGWLEQRVGKLSDAGEAERAVDFSLYPLGGHVNWQRHRSLEYVDFKVVRVPFTRYDVTGSPPNGVAVQPRLGYLLGERAPFIADFRIALLKSVYSVGLPNASEFANVSPTPTVAVRLADRRAYLRHVAIGPAGLRVEVDGEQLVGTRLFISDSAGLYSVRELEKPRIEGLLLQDGVPPAMDIVLARGSQWLDYRHIDDRFPILKAERAGVTIERPQPSLETELEALVAQGEGLSIEYKSSLNEDKQRLLCSVSAFANAVGGTILLGVTKDGKVCGLVGDVPDIRDSVMRTIRDNIKPMPNVEPFVVHLGGESVLAIVVQPTTKDPCAVIKQQVPYYYLRRDATNYHAQPDEITELVLSRNPAPVRHNLF